MKYVILLIMAAIISVGGYTLLPAYHKDKLIGIVSSASDERKCFNFHKDYFLDPDSAYIDSSYKWSREDALKYGTGKLDSVYDKFPAVLRIKVRAKNAFGAYISNHVECPLTKNGFDKHKARMHRIDKLIEDIR